MTAPAHLSTESKRIYRRIAQEYELKEDSALILQAGLEQWDRLRQARAEIAQSKSLLLEGRKHPLLEVEKTAVSLFLRAFSQLGLDITPLGAVGAPVKRF